MRYPAPLPVLAQIAIQINLEKANHRPAYPQESTVREELRVICMVDGVDNRRASSV